MAMHTHFMSWEEIAGLNFINVNHVIYPMPKGFLDAGVIKTMKEHVQITVEFIN